MEGYKRAYKDSNSPLTPLTPLLGNFFNFNIDTEIERVLVPPNQQQKTKHSVVLAGVQGLCSLVKGERSYTLEGKASSDVDVGECATINVDCENRSAIALKPVPAQRLKRAHSNKITINEERTNRCVPAINIVPPPRRKRCAQFERTNASNEKWNVELLCENSEFVHQQQQQLEKYQHNRRFDVSKVRLTSPVPPKPLSPRLGAFLASWGMNCLMNIFERQEIDMEVFCCLTQTDLDLLGIEDPIKRELVLKAVNYLKNSINKREC